MRVLVAGIGNVFQRDDGFGCEVAARLAREEWPADVTVRDYGIRGVHLAFDLLDGCDLVVLVDALRHDEPPGTVVVLEAGVDPGAAPPDAHALDPVAVLAMVGRLGGTVPRTLVVGCEPLDCTDGMGLTPTVEAAVPHAMQAVRELVQAVA